MKASAKTPTTKGTFKCWGVSCLSQSGIYIRPTTKKVDPRFIDVSARKAFRDGGVNRIGIRRKSSRGSSNSIGCRDSSPRIRCVIFCEFKGFLNLQFSFFLQTFFSGCASKLQVLWLHIWGKYKWSFFWYFGWGKGINFSKKLNWKLAENPGFVKVSGLTFGGFFGKNRQS